MKWYCNKTINHACLWTDMTFFHAKQYAIVKVEQIFNNSFQPIAHMSKGKIALREKSRLVTNWLMSSKFESIWSNESKDMNDFQFC